MGKIRPGNKQNAGINGEWGAHVGKDDKKITSGLRRAKLKKNTDDEMKDSKPDYEDVDDPHEFFDEDAEEPYNEELN